MSEDKPVIYPASKITVQNQGGYVMTFFARWDNGETKGMGTYPIGQERTMDLATHPHDKGARIAPGKLVHPRCEISAGKNVSGPEVRYDPNAGEVVYRATRSTMNAGCGIWKVNFGSPTHELRITRIQCIANSASWTSVAGDILGGVIGSAMALGKLRSGKGTQEQLPSSTARMLKKQEETGEAPKSALQIAWDRGNQLADEIVKKTDTIADHVYMEVSGNRVWGGSKGTKMKPKDELDLDVTFKFRDFCHLTLFEYDYVSNDDNLGAEYVEGQSEPYTKVDYVSQKGEDSLYQIVYTVSPL